MEGDSEQRRAAAREARERGASKQRRHVGDEASHEEKMAGPGLGTQDPDRHAGRGRPREQDEP